MYHIGDNNKFRWIECFDFISGRVYYLSLNSDGKIKLKDSIVKNVDIEKYFQDNKLNNSEFVEINKKQMDDLMNIDNYSLMKMDKFEFAKKYNLEQEFI